MGILGFGFCVIVWVLVCLTDFLYVSLFACFDFQVLIFVIVFHVFIVVVLGENMKVLWVGKWGGPGRI